VPPHADVFVAEHWRQAPLDWQAGVGLEHSPSPAHARHVWVAALQTGVVPEQSALARQETQLPVAV